LSLARWHQYTRRHRAEQAKLLDYSYQVKKGVPFGTLNEQTYHLFRILWLQGILFLLLRLLPPHPNLRQRGSDQDCQAIRIRLNFFFRHVMTP